MNVPHSDMSVLNLTEIDLQEQGACDTINIEVEPVPFVKGTFFAGFIFLPVCRLTSWNFCRTLRHSNIDYLQRIEFNEAQLSFVPNRRRYREKRTDGRLLRRRKSPIASFERKYRRFGAAFARRRFTDGQPSRIRLFHNRCSNHSQIFG